MDNLAPPNLFLDSALIISAILSSDPASAGRRLLKMGEVGLIHLSVSERVIAETEGVLRGVAGEGFDRLKVQLAENLALANIATASPPSEQGVQECLALTQYRPDAEVLAAAIERGCEVLVTYDKTHLLKNPNIGPLKTRIVVMSGGEALEWAIDQVSVRSRLRLERKRGR